jgi:hypothetical protein
MERCAFCQAEREAGARLCRQCGRLQPSGPIPEPLDVASGSMVEACPACGQPAEPQDRFCRRCAYPLRQSCLMCRQESGIWARFCPSCGAAFALSGAQQAESGELQAMVGFSLPEGAQLPTLPTAPGTPQSGMPHIPAAPAGSQMGVPSSPGAPAGPQSGAPSVPSAPGSPQAGPPGIALPAQAGRAAHLASTSATRALAPKLLGTATGKVIAAVVAVAVVATGTVAIAAATGHQLPASGIPQTSSHSGSSTRQVPPPPPPEVTYVGGDGNIWEMTLPGGTPRQLTNDAKPGDSTTGAVTITYAGLAWSPDGKRLAVIRTSTTATASASALLLLSPNGALLSRHPILQSAGDSLAWSPDGHFLAYHQGAPNSPTGELMEEVVILDATTGAPTRTLTYKNGIGGCGGGGFPATEALIWAAHHAFVGIDTFDWSFDGQTLLVPFDCQSASAVLLHLTTSTSTPGYPAGASFQPGGPLILGSERGVALTDQAGKLVSRLANSSGAPPYANGEYQEATWNRDGQTIYYEYQDGIWRIRVDGSGAQQIIAGAPIVNNQATIEVAPRLSPDGSRLLYLEVHGDAVDAAGVGTATARWYVAQADGSGALPLPHGTISAQLHIVEAIWRPGT